MSDSFDYWNTPIEDMTPADAHLYSDRHKDAFGFRPGPSTIAWFNALTDAERTEELAELDAAFERSEEERKLREKRCLALFNSKLRNFVTTGKGSERDAVAALFAENRVEYMACEAGYFEFLMGIPYGTLAERGLLPR